ncbi:hypothetical protein Btru_076177 [Bulinus truncatus]|nr:hypothetical protein Btru_076177 [Bulinus truncatus]
MYYFLLICLVAVEICPASTALNETMSQWREAKSMLKSQVLSHRAVRGKLCPAEKNNTVSLLFKFLSYEVLACNELEQSFTTVNLLGVFWQDPDISWNPEDFEGIDLLNLDYNDLWHPIIMVTNSADPELTVVSPLNDQLQIKNNGEIEVLTPLFLTTTCSFDLSRYPFDVQECEVIFLPFIADCKFNVSSESYEGLNDPFQLKGEWDIVDQALSPSAYFTKYTYTLPTVRVTLKISRSSLFYIITVISPMVLTSLMTTFVFLIPPESGEKVSFLVSIFVSDAVFLNFISGTIPRSMTLSKIPRLTLFLIGVMIQSFLALLATIFVMEKYKREQEDIGIKSGLVLQNPLEGKMPANEESDPQHQSKVGDRIHCQSSYIPNSFSLNSPRVWLLSLIQKHGLNYHDLINMLSAHEGPIHSQITRGAWTNEDCIGSAVCKGYGSNIGKPVASGQQEAHPPDHYWTGDNACKKVSVWIYQRSQMPVRFFFWGQGEPNNANGGEDCMIIWPLIDYLIVDTSCVDNTFWKFVYVCEVDN